MGGERQQGWEVLSSVYDACRFAALFGTPCYCWLIRCPYWAHPDRCHTFVFTERLQDVADHRLPLRGLPPLRGPHVRQRGARWLCFGGKQCTLSLSTGCVLEPAARPREAPCERCSVCAYNLATACHPQGQERHAHPSVPAAAARTHAAAGHHHCTQPGAQLR